MERGGQKISVAAYFLINQLYVADIRVLLVKKSRRYSKLSTERLI